MPNYDYIIIGGGIVGISTARQLQQRCPNKRILVLEKEAQLASHQTGHNSGVIHAGVYYPSDSLKAQFCKQGLKDTLSFCRENHIPYKQCGKLLVATTTLEMDRMQALYARCQHNDIAVELLDQKTLRSLEPNITGLGAIRVMDTGIVDYKKITTTMAQHFQHAGGELRLQNEVTGLSEQADHITVSTHSYQFRCRFLISCSGLMADRTTRMLGIHTEFAILPFRGEYYQLPPQKNALVNHLIYPIPDPELPFLGVHLTRMIDGGITVGPNAILGWKREGYAALNISLRDSWETLRFGGFWALLRHNYKFGLQELKNAWWKRGYLRLVRKYCPELTLNDLKPYPAGIRAQAVMKDGSLVHDFLFAESPRSLHVCNAPSPAATSAIPIGKYLCEKVLALSDGEQS